MTQRITLDPDPPVAGQAVKVCYDFDGTQLTEVQLAITFTPPPTTSLHTVTLDDPCVHVDVPPGATQMTVEDRTGTSPDKVAPVV